MRIVHLSDIHLSKSNYDEFQNNYKSALIKDLLEYHSSTPIDLIVITGDLVDKGGDSLLDIPEFGIKDCPYDIFEIVFLNPIISALKIDKHRILFIPGNHDVDEKEILLFEESELVKNINDTNINNHLSENIGFKHSHRIRKFKEFEQKYHTGSPNYTYSPNQSTYIFQDKGGMKVGFILINDSWRCKSVKLHGEEDTFYFGIQQLHNGIKILENEQTKLNICLFHHSVNNYKEQIEVERALSNKNIELFLYGHYHSTKFEKLYTSSYKSSLGIRGRAALFKPNEISSEYQSGYLIIDIDLHSYKVSEINYRQYKYKFGHFDFDTDATLGGVDKGQDGKGIQLDREGRVNNILKLDINQFKL